MNTTAGSSNSNSRVLIVDDNSEFTHRASEFLQDTHRYVVCEENDPRRALETARNFHPDLILLDLIMPQADGAEVAAQITSDWMLHSVPIVFVTALITREEARDGRRIEGHRVVPKPGHGSELIKVVEESLPKRFNNASPRVVKQKSSWNRITKPADLQRLRDSSDKRMFAIVSPPITAANRGRPTRNVLIFDNHPASLRLVRDIDLASPRPTLAQFLLLSVLVILALAIGISCIA
ncbi:MAG TPA: response regulator [Chthoniobacterales bacterium]|jgi:CheY-like chemotaxis protein|nr:response regulator [Chthoniobacterales bacterium]